MDDARIIEQRGAAVTTKETLHCGYRFRRTGKKASDWTPRKNEFEQHRALRAAEELGHLAVLDTILPLDIFHLIFEPQLQFFEADFLNLFIVRQEPLLCELLESFGILGVFHGQLLQNLMTR
jgi:hypothetical protein